MIVNLYFFFIFFIKINFFYSSIYKDNLVFPEEANSELKRLAQQKHRELKKQYDQYLDRNSGQAIKFEYIIDKNTSYNQLNQY